MSVCVTLPLSLSPSLFATLTGPNFPTLRTHHTNLRRGWTSSRPWTSTARSKCSSGAAGMCACVCMYTYMCIYMCVCVCVCECVCVLYSH